MPPLAPNYTNFESEKKTQFFGQNFPKKHKNAFVLKKPNTPKNSEDSDLVTRIRKANWSTYKKKVDKILETF